MDVIQRENIKLDGIDYAVQEMKRMIESGITAQDAITLLECRVREGRDAIHEWYVSRAEFI